MFIACPQCRYLVATDPRTQAVPAYCPRCSAVLDAGNDTPSPISTNADNTAAGGQSLASLLRRDESPVAHETASVAAAGADAVSASSETQAEQIVAIGHAAAEEPLSGDGQELSTLDNDVVAAAPAADARAEPVAVALSSAAPAKPLLGARAPAFLGGRNAAVARHGTPLWQWALLVVLLLSLTLQMLLADRARLAADASWRPLLSSLCGVLGCSIPAWHEPQAFVMLDRDVRPVPNVAGVLQARATFRNDARWSQPWPILLLTLKDADGRDLGARAITPAEYLRGSAAMTELAPGQSAQVAVNLREPSANVVAFSFDFR